MARRAGGLSTAGPSIGAGAAKRGCQQCCESPAVCASSPSCCSPARHVSRAGRPAAPPSPALQGNTGNANVGAGNTGNQNLGQGNTGTQNEGAVRSAACHAAPSPRLCAVAAPRLPHRRCPAGCRHLELTARADASAFAPTGQHWHCEQGAGEHRLPKQRPGGQGAAWRARTPAGAPGARALATQPQLILRHPRAMQGNTGRGNSGQGNTGALNSGQVMPGALGVRRRFALCRPPPGLALLGPWEDLSPLSTQPANFIRPLPVCRGTRAPAWTARVSAASTVRAAGGRRAPLRRP